MQPILSINNLSIYFNTDAGISYGIKQVTINIAKGEFVAIVGESGSGKSITALSILQLLPKEKVRYSSGNILFFDAEPTNILSLEKNAIRQIRGNKIAMIFQEPMTALNPVKTCGGQVLEAILAHEKISEKAAKARVINLFNDVQIPEPELSYNKYPHQLSGGQKQRVMIAMAISCNPSLLICDEPTTALDVTVQQNILLLIKQLQKQRDMGVLFITHDLGVVANYADKVMVLYKGALVEEGLTQQIIYHPAHSYTKALLACRPANHQKGTRLPVVDDFLQTNISVSIPKIEATKAKFSEEPLPILQVSNAAIWHVQQTNIFGTPTHYNKAVNGVSFTITKGETLGIVGESGCGKSTLGRAILGLLPLQSGNIIYNGQSIHQPHLQKYLRKQIQLIFQDPYGALNPRKTVGDAITEPILFHQLMPNKKAAKEKAIHLLQQVGLQAIHYDRYPNAFSGGQRQRIVIARALAVEPSFIVCDEMVSALDVSVQAQVLNLLNDLKNSYQFTSIFISHDLNVVRYIADNIAVMQAGKIVEMGNADTIYHQPQHPYTQQLLAAIPSF